MKQYDYQKMDGFFSGSEECGQPSGEFRRWAECEPSDLGWARRKLDFIDLVCGGLLLLAAILGICFWGKLSDALFFGLLYPILSAGGQLIAALVLLALALGWLRRKFDRFWY